MNRITPILVLLIALGLPAVSAGEGVQEEMRDPGRLPVTRVTLYTAGLAWMVHETTVTDDEVLYFPADQKDINDILKSLVVEDLDGGTVDSVNFDSENPLSAALADMRVNPSGSPALTDFLRRTQGEEVSVTTPGGTYSGRIFSVETVVEGESRTVRLNLMDRESLRSVDITELEGLAFTDAALQQEMLRALDLIARSRVKTARTLKLSFRGTGTRRVRLSYIRAVPLWKTSYRIVLDEEGTPRLVGWALVQNTGSRPWTEVQLSFAAGQPNAFTMDLATPRYVRRRQVQTAAAAPLGPTEYDRGYAPEPAPMAKESYRSEAAGALAFGEAMADEAYMEEETYAPAPVASQAAGTRSGNFYRYDVTTPVTVDARSSAMIPIIQQPEAGRTLGLYDPAHNLVFKGLRLTNTTGAHWAAGPVTVSEGRFYGGDALIPEMIPGSERLITYAVHGTLEVQKIPETSPRRIEKLRIVDGLLYRTDKIERETVYRIEGEETELILIHPREAGWTLTEHPEIAEETASSWRFRLDEWDEPVRVAEEYLISRQFSLAGFRISDISTYLGWEDLSDEMEEAFEQMAVLLRDKERIRSEISSLDGRISRMERDQNRVRENMKVLEPESDLYKRYSSQLAEQEDEIQTLNRQLTAKQEELKKAEEALRRFIAGLDLS